MTDLPNIRAPKADRRRAQQAKRRDSHLARLAAKEKRRAGYAFSLAGQPLFDDMGERTHGA